MGACKKLNWKLGNETWGIPPLIRIFGILEIESNLISFFLFFFVLFCQVFLDEPGNHFKKRCYVPVFKEQGKQKANFRRYPGQLSGREHIADFDIFCLFDIQLILFIVDIWIWWNNKLFYVMPNIGAYLYRKKLETMSPNALQNKGESILESLSR